MQIIYPDLPIVEKKQAILEALKAHQVIVVAGETGSGKTTQLPKICLEAGFGSNGLIGHTQPRRIAARTVAIRIASELQTEVGSLVGYKVRFSDKTNPNSLIKIMTDGILLSEMQHDKMLSKYDCIIVDEAHERSLNIDFLLGFLKRILKKRSDLKVIVTSATIDVEKFSHFFENAPIIEIEGRTFPVEVKYVDPENVTPDTDPVLQIVDVVKEICVKGPGDILIFQSGEKEIRDLMQVLQDNIKEVELLPLFARLSVGDQQRIFTPGAKRKVIVATNVAETSLTVPNVRFVIDSGFARISRYQYRSKLQRLPIEPISQASANQRKGRCGRVGPGICYRLYTEEEFLTRPLYTEPEILRTNLAGVILKMLSLGIEQVTSFPFIDPPDNRYVKDGFTLLQRLSAVNLHNKITPLGRTLANIPIEPRLGRILLAGDQYGALKEILVIVSALSIADPRERPLEFQEKADLKHSQFMDEKSDFMTLVNLWHFVREQRKKLSHQKFRKLCRENFLSFIRICEWFDIYTQLLESCKELGLKLNQISADYSLVHKALLTGCIDKIGLKEEKANYQGARNLKFVLHPSSHLMKKPPLWVMAYEIVHTFKVYARTNAQVEVEWIEEVGQPLLKKQLFEPHFDKKRAQVVAFERATLFGLEISKRKVNYEKRFPREAREIFIQQGLVEEELDVSCEFYVKNKETLHSLQLLEERFRHRYHLVNDQLIYRFYDKKIPPDVASKTALLQWIKVQGEDSLIFRQEDVAALVLSEDILQSFPEYLMRNNQRLYLEYHYDLNSVEDGVTVLVPVSLLGLVQEDDFSWLIPGLRHEKIAAYLKALPKSYRTLMMPLNDFILRVKELLNPQQGTFQTALLQALQQLLKISFPITIWDKTQFAPYLHFHYKVIDEKGTLLAQGEDIHLLYETLKKQHPDFFTITHPLQAKDKLKWDFGVLPLSTLVSKNALNHTLYPACVDKQETVAVELFETEAAARKQHRRGLTRLYLLQLSEKCRLAKRNITPIQKKALTKLYSAWGSVEECFEEIFYNCAFSLFVDKHEEVRSSAQFESQLQRKGAEFLLTTNRMLALVFDILQQYAAVQQKRQVLEKLPDTRSALLDIENQLQALLSKHFIKETPLQWLSRYPLYLKAIMNRLEGLPRAAPRDKTLMADIQVVSQAYLSKLRAKPDYFEDSASALFDFRWKIEELRLSYFAQGLRTVEPVSKIRLLKLLQ